MRALAQAAARAGFTPCAIDGFADRDTRLACQGRALRLPARGCVPDWALLDDAIGEMRRRHAPRGFAGAVAGGGLEACPELLDVLRRHAPLANADKEAVLVPCWRALVLVASLLAGLAETVPQRGSRQVHLDDFLGKRHLVRRPDNTLLRRSGPCR